MFERSRRSIAVAIAAAALLGTSTVRAQTDGEVAAARKLFAEAVKDEEKKEFESALEKLRRVQAVKDTAGVRYRIATCLESVGRLKEALASYRGAADLADSEAAQRDIAASSRDKAAELEKRLPALTLTLSAKAPADAVVELDERPLTASELGRPVSVEAGLHRVTARGNGAAPFETQVTLPEGARFALTVPLDPVSGPENPPTTTSVSESSNATLGWVLVGAGAVLVASAGVTWLVRQSAISSIKDDCPNDRCPESARSEVTSADSRANLMVPLTLIFGIGGLAAAGTGAFLLVQPSKSQGPKKEPALPAAAGGLQLRPSVVPNGATIMLGGSF